MTIDEFVFGQNLVWAVFAGSVAVFFSIRLYRRWRDGVWDGATQLMAGVVLVSFGCVLHRLYWAIWRSMRANAGPQSPDAEWFVANAGFLLLPISLIAFGYLLHLSPVVAKVFGRWWLVAGAGFGLAVFFVGVSIA